jgi:hypothetical protein
MRFGSSVWLLALTAAIAALVASSATAPVKASDDVMRYQDVDAWFV